MPIWYFFIAEMAKGDPAEAYSAPKTPSYSRQIATWFGSGPKNDL